MDAPVDMESELLQRLAGGDVRGAAHLLVQRYADEVFGLCRAMVRDPITAEDLSQDVFGRAFTALPSFRGDASVRTWILRIARNRCIDHLRARQREPWEPWDDADPDGQPAAEPTIADLLTRREDVTRALDALREAERAVVVLRFGHGLGYPELAEAFGLGEGAVRMRVSRAVAKMRDAIAEQATPADAFGRGVASDGELAAALGRDTEPDALSAPPSPRRAPAPPPVAAAMPPPRGIPGAGAPPSPRRAPGSAPAPAAPPPQSASSKTSAPARAEEGARRWRAGAVPAARKRQGILGRLGDFLRGPPSPASEEAPPEAAAPEPPALRGVAPATLRARLEDMLDGLRE